MKEDIIKIINQVPEDGVNIAIKLITTTIYGRGRIFVVGNGGLAEIANHFVADLTQDIYIKNGIHAISLSSNVATLTAIANDIGVDALFYTQLKAYGTHWNDLIILFSTDGKSPNILQTISYAEKNEVPVILITTLPIHRNYSFLVPIVVPVDSLSNTAEQQAVAETVFTYLAHRITIEVKNKLKEDLE